jgi:hypothetical protein
MDLNNPEIKRWTDSGTACWGVTDEYKGELILDYARRFNLMTFVETGTWHGGTVEYVKQHFDQIHSIELSPELVENCRKRFSGSPNIHLYQGDSGEKIKELFGGLKTPTLFWLDAHPSGGDTVGTYSPLEKELTAIFESGVKGVILIDDLQDCWEHNWAEVAMRTVAKYSGWRHEITHGIMRIVSVDASVIIPLYNLQDFVGQTIESALNQTHRFFEVIVVNDGSTDGSLNVAKRYGDRIILIDQQNAGLNASRNAGARVSTGTFLLPLDADDWIEPTYLEKTIPLMTEGIGVVSTDMDIFGEVSRADISGEVNRLQPIGRPTLEIQKWANTMPCCSLIRRTAFNQAGGYSARPDIQAYGDWNLWIDILKRGWKVASLAEPLFHYRVRPISMSLEVSSKHAELAKAIRRNHPDLFRLEER